MKQKRFTILILSAIIAILVGVIVYSGFVKPTNLIKSIRTVPSGIEIEVTSDKEFPVRNELAVLHIGVQEFTVSRYPESGDTHTLIFTLTVEEFAKTTTGNLVTVKYGRGGEPSEQWNFGPLDKSLLDKKR